MIRSEGQARKEQSIKDEYKALADKKMYLYSYICQVLAVKYFLSPATIDAIVTGQYDARRARITRDRKEKEAKVIYLQPSQPALAAVTV